MCEKYVKDGQVAILISPGFGAGWSTWESTELCYDKRVVEKFLEGASVDEMHSYLSEIGYDDVYMGGYDGLEIKWIPVGTKFIIEEYDGSEYLRTIDEINWMTA